MTSAIDATKPSTQFAYTVDMRNNFATAASEITALQEAMETATGGGTTPGPFLPCAGGTVTGPVYITATGGTTPRSAQDRAADRLNVKDFYTGNWDAAFDAAFAALPAGGGTIVVPAGSYTWAAPHVWANKPVSLIGDGKGVSNVNITHTGTGLTINQTGTNAIFNRINISGFTFYAAASGGPTYGAIAINYPSGALFPAAFGYETFTASQIEMLSSTGTAGPTWAQAFLTGITMVGTWMAKLTDIHFFGVPTNPGLAGSYAIGLGQSEDTRIVHLYAQYGQAGISILDHGEGLAVISPTFLGTDWAIDVATSAPAGGQPLWNLLQVNDAEMNCYLGILNIRNMQNVTVTDCDMTRFADSGAACWTVFQLSDCNWCTLVNNFISGGGASQATNRYVVLTYVAWGCFHNEIHNQVVPNQMGVYTLFSGSSGLALYNGITWTNGGARYATQPIQIGNNTTLQLNDNGGAGTGLTFLVGSDNHFDVYSSNGSGGSLPIWDFYVDTAAPTQTFHIPTVFSDPATIANNTGALQLNDASGFPLKLLVGPDNHVMFFSTNSAGAGLMLFDFYAHSDTPTLSIYEPVHFASYCGFNGSSAIPKPTVTGAKGGNAALTSLVTALANYGLVTDSTT